MRELNDENFLLVVKRTLAKIYINICLSSNGLISFIVSCQTKNVTFKLLAFEKMCLHKNE